MTPAPLHDNGKAIPGQRAFILAAAILLITALFCPAAAARDVKVALPELRPMVFTDDQGKPAGLFVDIIEDIAIKEDWNIIWVHGTHKESWDRLAAGEIDLIMGVADTPEREKLYDFNHEPALSAWSQVYARGGSGINTILDLDGKRVALLKGDINAIEFRSYARKFDINITYIEKDNLDDVFAMTAAGDADAAVLFSLAGEQSANRYGLSDTPVMFNPTSLVFAVPKGKNPDILSSIDRYLAEGKASPSSTYSRSVQKWFGMKADWVVPSYIWWGLAVVAGIAVLFVVMSIVLRLQVKKKTAELSRQNEELQSEVANRKRAEQELADEMSRRKILIDQSRDGIVILDREGCVHETNRRFAEMLGYTREEMQQLHVWDWDARFSREQLHGMIRAVDAGGDHFESRHRRKDGTIIDVEISSNAAEFSGQKLIFCVVRDTSERKKAEEELRTVNLYLQEEVKNRARAEAELARKNAELNAAYGQLTATEETLRQNFSELSKSEHALMQARKKLNLLNTLTFEDIQNAVFSLAGFIQLAKGAGCSEEARARLKKGEDIVHSIENSLDFAKKYQNLGLSQPRWQNVNYVFINAISHLDFSNISRAVDLPDLEIYADPLLEDVFFILMQNVILHGAGATRVSLRCRHNADSITILVEDNGPGISAAEKENIFLREYTGKAGTSLFLAREILSITDISIRETGEPGKGVRFEIAVPKGEYRISGT